MAQVPNTFRTECCQVLMNALADEEKSSLVLSVIPYRSRRSTRYAYTALVHVDGRTLASCRHEMTDDRIVLWADWITQLVLMSAMR